MVTPGRDALAVDAGVEGVWAARCAVGNGGAEQVVGRGLLHAAEQVALVRTAN